MQNMNHTSAYNTMYIYTSRYTHIYIHTEQLTRELFQSKNFHVEANLYICISFTSYKLLNDEMQHSA